MSSDSSKSSSGTAFAAARQRSTVTLAASSSTQGARVEQAKPGRLPYGPLAAVLIVVISYVLSQIVGGALISIYPHLRGWSYSQTNHWLQDNVAVQFFYVFISEAFTVGILLLFLRYRRAGVASIGLRRRPRFGDAGWSIIGITAYFMLFTIGVAVAKLAVHIDDKQQQDVGFQHVAGLAALAITFVSLVILPPLVEELTFRGFLYSGFRRRFGVLIATLGTSLLFAAPHLLEATNGKLLWIAGLDTFILSLVACQLRERTGTIWAGMGVHALKNCVAFFTLYHPFGSLVTVSLLLAHH